MGSVALQTVTLCACPALSPAAMVTLTGAACLHSVQLECSAPSTRVWNRPHPGQLLDASSVTAVAPLTVKVACTPSHTKDTLAGCGRVRPDQVAALASSVLEARGVLQAPVSSAASASARLREHIGLQAAPPQ